jgi:serine/threonine protein kinase
MQGEEPDFGIQRISNPEFANYEAEVRYLGQYLQGGSGSQHVVQLLTWFKHWGQLYLVYFWSPGDLGMYWKLSRPRMTHDFICWFSRQWEGIAKALCRVHRLPVAPSKPHAGLKLRTATPSPRQQAINRALSLGHATFTPQNILWFPHGSFDGCSDPNGILQLGVLGSCFSGLERERLFRVASSEPFCPNRTITYAAPEQVLDRSPRMGRRRSDVWSLGCIFLEAATWLILGPAGVEMDFPEARVWLPSEGSRRVYDITDDGFFCVTMDDGAGGAAGQAAPAAIVNPGVTDWIAKLRAHARCSAYLDEFLDMIANGMLVVEDGSGRERVSAEALASVLGCLREKAERDVEFALKPKFKGTAS